MNQQSTSEVVMRLRKQEEEDRLKMMLQKLTEEMRAQHYGNDITEEAVVAKEETKDYKTLLSLPTSTPKENTRSTPSLLVTEAANKNSGSTKNNSVVSKISNEESAASFISKSSRSKVHHSHDSKSVKSVGNPSKSLRSQVEQVSFRHQQVLDSIKNSQPDLLDGPDIVQAELNQMGSIQDAECQLHQIIQIRDVVTARNETASYAQVRHFEIMVMFLIFP